MFLFLNENICCGYSLEAPRRGASNEYPQHMYSLRNKKNIMWIPPLICGYAETVQVPCISFPPLTLILLFTTTPTFANSVDPDLKKPSDQDLHCLSFSL